MSIKSSDNEQLLQVVGTWSKGKFVAKESGKGLSTNDYTTAEKNKLAGIQAGAEANVQSDWNQSTTTADDFIKNKPDLSTYLQNSGNQFIMDGELSIANNSDPMSVTAANVLSPNQILIYCNEGTTEAPDMHYAGLSAEAAAVWTMDSEYNEIVVPIANIAQKSEIPSVNNPTVTITQAGVTKGSFTLNQASSTTIALDYQDQVQSDWNNSTTTSPAYIKNKPDLTQYATTATVNALSGRVSTVEGKIPAAATTTNQLADKAFVNSSIATETAHFLGTNSTATTEAEFLTWANALANKTNNDYTFWSHTVSSNPVYDRYKYSSSTSSWSFEYRLNNSSFTAAQWSAINSGVTSTKVSGYDSHVSSTTNPHNVTAAQVGAYTTTQTDTLLAGKAASSHNHAASNITSGTFDLARIPTIPSTKTSGFATVATSGSYNDLSNKPTIPSTTDCEKLANKVTSWSTTVNDTHYPSEKLVKNSIDAKYTKPGTGIPKSDLASDVQTSLGKADTALQNETYRGTVTSVRVQASSPVVSSQNTAQTGTLNTTISLASGYGDSQNPYASKTASFVLAAPNGSNGVPTFRALLASDVSDITYMSTTEMISILNAAPEA